MFSTKYLINDKPVSQLKVMIVDDDFHLSRLYSAQLNAYGFDSIKVFQQSQDALKEANQRKYDIIILEWDASPVAGPAFAHEMRKNEKSPSAGAVLVGMCSRPEEKVFFDMLNAGVDAIVVKPVSADTLLKHIRLNLENPRVFVKTESYYGPDRRRGIKVQYRGENRRKMEATLEARPG